MAPRVSVIIPAHNARASLGETLDSVIAQTYGDWEAIVADDASTDGTGSLATGYHPRVSCVRSERKLGIGGARNLALARATGELVALLDGDDIWLPEYLERQLAGYDEAVASGRRVGIVCCDTYEFDHEGRRELTFFERIGWSGPATLTTLLRNNTIFVSAVIPRATLDQLGGFATDCLGVEDYDLWLRILESGRVVVTVPEPLALYRRGEASVSANLAGMAIAMQTAYRHALERGRLDASQRAIVRRELRMQRLLELWVRAVQLRGETDTLPWISLARLAPLGACVVLERPERWSEWARRGAAALRGSVTPGMDSSHVA